MQRVVEEQFAGKEADSFHTCSKEAPDAVET